MRAHRPIRLLAALLAIAAAAVALALAGRYAAVGPRPWRAPVASALSSAAQGALRAERVVLAQDAATRRAEMLTLRVRNISCGSGSGTGSGFAIGPHTLITNRHVIAGAAVLQLDAWDGTSIDADVSQAQTGRLVDIGLVHLAATLPIVARTGLVPAVGQPVTAVGYPLGGPLTLTPGRVLGLVDGRSLDPPFPGQVIATSAPIHHGNSGGPLLDSEGRVVGVVYAGEQPTGPSESAPFRVGLAIPLSEVGQLLADGGSQAVVPCG